MAERARVVTTTNEDKLDTLAQLARGEQQDEVARIFKVHRSTVWRWGKQQAALELAAPRAVLLGGKTAVSAVTKYVENRLLEWIRMMRTARFLCVSTECIRLALAQFDPAYIANRSHKAAVMYIQRFLKRNGLTLRRITHHGQKPRSDMQRIADRFAQLFQYRTECLPFLSCHTGAEKYNFVFNMDQISIYIDMNPASTIEFVGTRNVDVVQTMSPNSVRASIFLCASAVGVKLRPLIVFAGVPDETVHRELYSDPAYDWDAAHFTVQRNAYCDGRVMEEWIQDVWRPEVAGPSVLLLDNLKVHKMDNVKVTLERDCHTRLEFVPPGVTGLCQPMDVAVMKPFKTRCRQLYLYCNQEQGFCTNPREKRKRITEIVARAWSEISSDVIIAGFVKAKLVYTGDRNEHGQVSLEIPPPDES